MRIRGRGVVLERLVVGDVVVLEAVLSVPPTSMPTGCTVLQMPWLVEFGTELWNPAFLNSSGTKVARRLAGVGRSSRVSVEVA